MGVSQREVTGRYRQTGRRLLVTTMSSALSYYTSKNRASERLENKRNEISRSSAYIIDNSSSNRSSYSSYGGDSRTSRSTYRDRSLDFSARASHRSASRDLGSVKLRTRDHSTDISNGYRRDYSSGYTTSR